MLKRVIALLLFAVFLNGEDLTVLLSKIKQSSDLSKKTKLENSGIVTIYTRDDLERMQVKRLKDILKYLLPVGYKENRYGLPDPYYLGTSHPFMSSSMRLFIDDQEYSVGLFGSGIVAYGDFELNNIDHIEIYGGSPTYEFSVEPTFILIKLYTKKAQRDGGNKITLQRGSLGDSLLNYYKSDTIKNDWSYFAYVAQDNNKRKKYQNYKTKLSRDKKSSHIFISLYNENNKILIDGTIQKRDSFADMSLDATPTKAEIKNDIFHIGYNGKNSNWSYLLSYDILNIDSDFKDDVSPLPSTNYSYPISSFQSKSSSTVLSSELKWTYKTKINKFITGVKYRHKWFRYDKLLRNEIELSRSGHTYQDISTIFAENQYSIKDNSIVNLGISLSEVKNNHSVQNDNLMMYRASHTWTTNSLILKSIYSHLELSLDPYLVNSYNFYITPGKKSKTKQDFFLENIIYEKGLNKYDFRISYIRSKDQLLPSKNSSLLDNHHNTIELKNIYLSWRHKYGDYNKFYTIFQHSLQNPKLDNFNTIKSYFMILRDLHTYKKFDFFNELYCYKDNLLNKNYYDYSFGVIFHKTEDFTISLKGVNLLNKAKPSSYYRINPQTFTKEEPLLISPVDRHIVVSMEYTF